MTTTKLTVPDMTCGHCERTVTETLSPLAGVQHVKVDLASHSIEVRYDPTRIDSDQLAAALAAEDYPVSASEVLVAS